MFAIIRRTRAGQPLMAADRQHLHHRVLNIGHSYRQSVLIMYLWAGLFSVTVVSLSVVRTRLVVFVIATAVAVLALLPVTMPSLRPWRLLRRRTAARPGIAAARPGITSAAHRRTARTTHRGTAPAVGGTVPAGPYPPAAPYPAAPAAPFPGDQLPRAGRLPGADPVNPFAAAYPAHPSAAAPVEVESPDPLAAPRPGDARPW
jgi:hypothetical protein